MFELWNWPLFLFLFFITRKAAQWQKTNTQEKPSRRCSSKRKKNEGTVVVIFGRGRKVRYVGLVRSGPSARPYDVGRLEGGGGDKVYPQKITGP